MNAMKRIVSICALYAFLQPAYAQNLKTEKTVMKYPESKKTSTEETYFGAKVSDPYRWLEDDHSDETKSWVNAQNKLTQTYLAQIPYRDAIRKRLTKLWNYEKFSAPFKEGKYTYFYKNDGLQNQAVLYRQSIGAQPEVFLDPNTFSVAGTTSLADIEFTDDGSLAAYQISEGGSDWRKVIILKTDDKTVIGDTLTNVKFSGIAWKRNEGFYYSSYEKPKGSELSAMTQYHRLYFHKLGTLQKDDQLIFGGDATQRRYIGASVTEDGNYLTITAANSTTGNELYIQDLSVENSKISKLVGNFDSNNHIVDSEGSKLFIFTNLSAPNNKVVTVDAADAKPQNWKDLIPETKNVLDISSAGGKLFAAYLKDATSLVMRYDYNGKLEETIKLPGVGSASGFNGKKNEKETFFTFTSYVYPATIFKYDIASGKSELFKKPGVDFDPTQFESKQLFYASADGTKIPMIITYKKGLKLNGKNPTYLYGYGGFSVSLTPAFSTSTILFLEQGGLLAIPNLRGGGEYGEKWHLAGTKLKKQNVFDDFIAAAEYLVNEKYTSANYLTIAGGSNGGLLVGACMTQRPELFKVALPAVGVLDMLRYNKFTAGAGWAYDYGTAEDSKEMFEYLFHYSPYHALKKGVAYPATMVTTADHDDRVVPAHSFKFAARLQEYHKGNAPTLIRIETKAGHGAGKSTTQVIDEQTDKWAFILYNMGIGYKE